MTEISSANKRIAKNSLFLSIRMVVVMAINLFITRVVLQVLGVVDYGIYNVVCGFVLLFAFISTSMRNGIQRYFNYELGKNGIEGANKVFCTAIYIQAILAIIIVVLLESVGPWYIQHKMVIPSDRLVAAHWIFQFAVLSFVIGIMQAPFAASVTAHERMNFFAVVSVVDALLKLGIVYLLLLIPFDSLIIYGLLHILISIINILLYYVYAKKNFLEIKFHRGLNKELFKNMLGFSGWNLFGSFSSVMKEQGVNLVINFFFGPVVNAARGVANQVNGGIQHFIQNITIPVRPQVIQSYAQGDLGRTMHLTYSISKLSCCCLLMMGIPASLEIYYVLHLWLGNNVPEHSGTFTIIILITSLIGNLNSAISGVVHATGKMKDYQLWGSLVSISSVPIAFLLLKIYSIPEIALLCVLVCSALSHFVCLVVVKRLIGMSLKDYFKKVVWPIIIVFVISFVVTYPAHLLIENSLLRLLVVTIIGVSSVLLSLYYIALDKSERILVKKLTKSVTAKFHRK